MVNSAVEDSPDVVTDIFLQPGEFYWGNQNIRIKTLLGSCVALTLWHPELKTGGMCHIMLPEKKAESMTSSHLNGKYAEDAISLFLNEIKKTKMDISSFQGKLFGGSNMFTAQERTNQNLISEIQDENTIRRKINEIGLKNISKMKSLITLHKIPILAESTGGERHRKIYFNIWNGEVWMDMKKGI